jgi:hypothetical protein
LITMYIYVNIIITLKSSNQILFKNPIYFLRDF